jgi:hypothetical protein
MPIFPTDLNEYRTTVTWVMGILFFLAGVTAFGVLGYRSYLVVRFSDAREIPATVLDVWMDSGKSPSVNASYEYQADGKRLTGDRVAVFSESWGTNDRLLAAKEAGQPVTCFVDRRDPGLCTLERRWAALDILGLVFFGTVFGYAGTLYLVRHLQAMARFPASRAPDAQ